MDFDEIIKRIVRVLFRNPGEWFSFRTMAGIIGLPEIDHVAIAAIVESRQEDLFLLTGNDRSFRLRTEVIQAIAELGLGNWLLPPIAHRQTIHEWALAMGTEAGFPDGHYCRVPENQILVDLVSGTVPDFGVINTCCWQQICRVRGRYPFEVREENWDRLCARRGHLFVGHNPDHF